MRHLLIAACAAALTTTCAFAQQQQQNPMNNSGQQMAQDQMNRARPQAGGGDAGAALSRVAEQRKQEAMRQGSRQVQVKEMSVWGLGELPPDLMSKAMDKLASDPMQAKLSVMQAANILDLTASAYADAGGASELGRQAEQLRELASKIGYRQVLTRDQLKEPFARAALAAAKFYGESAQRGVQANDEEKTGYSLKGAGAYLTAAHVFAGREPSADVSRAAYDADTLAVHIIKMSQPLTVGEEQMAGRGPDNQAPVGGAGTGGGAQPQGGGQGGDVANLPKETEQVVQNLLAAANGINLDANTANARD